MAIGGRAIYTVAGKRLRETELPNGLHQQRLRAVRPCTLTGVLTITKTMTAFTLLNNRKNCLVA
jgi:hypothetical protein